MNCRVLFTGLVSVFLSACAGTTPVPTATATATLFATPVPLPTFTATPVQLDLRVTGELVNCRYGPGTVYELVNELEQGESARVVGRNDAFSWWYIRDPGNPNGYCWVSAGVTELLGTATQLPVAPAPPVSVTNATLRAEPDRIVVGCSQFPQTIFLEAEITTDGPTFVTWKWEASTGVSSEKAIMVFEGAGTQVINDYYQIGAPNDYWIRLHVLEPTELIRQVNVPVSCAP
ncbi:MAG: SH3 domain-containing protein [Chloroflexi bacterium]|nr:SH3 domain-containing protein [Chloroflexota bacterium]